MIIIIAIIITIIFMIITIIITIIFMIIGEIYIYGRWIVVLQNQSYIWEHVNGGL